MLPTFFAIDVLARFDPTLIVWLIIGLFWFIANVTEQNRKKAKQRQQQERRRKDGQLRHEDEEEDDGLSELEDQVRDLYRRLSGDSVEPPPKRSPASKPGREKPTPIRVKKPQPDRRIQLDQPPTPQPVELPRSSVNEPGYSFAEIQEIQEAAEMDYDSIGLSTQEISEIALGDAHSYMNTRNLMVNLGFLKVNNPTIRIKSVKTTDSHRKHPDLKNRKILRSAFVAKVLMEPCKAMHDAPTEDANQM